MNEFLFFFHVFVLLVFLLISLKLGKKALISFVIIQTIFANLFVIKQINFLGMSITASDMYTISAMLGLNLIQEYFGKEEARKTALISFLFLFCFLVMSRIHLSYTPNLYDYSQKGYETVFSSNWRIIISSIAVFFISQHFDIFFYGFLKKKFSLPIVFNAGFSTFSSQLLDTVLFTVLGLWGVVGKVFDVMAVSFMIKGLTIVSSCFFIGLAKKIYKIEA